METLKARRPWSEVFQALSENNFNPRILYPGKLSFKIDGAIKVFHDKQKHQKIPKYHYKRFSKESCTQKMKTNKTMRGQAESSHRRRKDKESENNIDSPAPNPTLKQQKQPNDRNHPYLLILTLNVNGHNSPIKRHHMTNWIRKQDPTICWSQDTH
jgi:hypothetical protein